MNQKPFLKIFCILAFLAFASLSCWATAESIHLLLPSWPIVMCWVVAVGFFFIASWGTKLIVDSLNQYKYLEHKGVRLLGGIVILLIFWLACSMPTNTHTFFYRSVINDRVTSDIATTEGYLVQIRDNVTTEASIQARLTELDAEVEIKLGELKSEIFNSGNYGDGPKTKEILRQFAEIFGVVKVEPLSGTCTSVEGCQKRYDEYRKKIYLLRDTKKLNIIKEMTPSNNNHRKLAENNCKQLELVKKYIKDGTLDLNNADDVRTICDKLNDGYATIRTYSQFVEFKDDADKLAYTSPNAVTKVKRMVSVVDVWKDFLKGEYTGYGLIFWVLISILVDIAAFILFALI